MVRTVTLILCLLFVSFVSAEEPQQIVALEFTGELPPDYQPEIDPNAQYRVEITFKFNDIDGNLALWLAQEMKKYQVVDETCSYTFTETRISEKSVVAEELGKLEDELNNERRKVRIEQERLYLQQEIANLKETRDKIANGKPVESPKVAYESRYTECMESASSRYDYEYCESLR